ncbi:MAG: CAP domain-containing protein [Luteolibacter sp.]|nr:CAP domain-containing protein [Luteolibacter sp.]
MRTSLFRYFFKVPGRLLWLSGGLMALALPGQGQALYDFGNLGPEEQFYLELINRARANPSAEGARLAATSDPEILTAYQFFKVNLNTMRSEFNSLPATPPLAPNALLTGTARSHSLWMFNNATQAHDETSPSNTPYTRMTGAGYNFSFAGENIYAYANSVEFGHAGFEVDWGSGGTGGMQAGRGHRMNIHSANFREIGLGVVIGSNGGVGPQLITQDFGTRHSSPTLGTGVAYYDLNSNNFYDVGEGISGLRVDVSGAAHYCNTAAGGGWTVPIPSGSTSRSVVFSGLNMNQSVSLNVSGTANAKADLKLAYAPPAITSSDSTHAGSPHTLEFAAVGGALGYKCSLSGVAPASPENCENTHGITSSTASTYQVVNTAVKQQGSASFHLANPNWSSQWIQLNGLYFAASPASISFQSRIRAATSTEHFKVQVREEGAANWQTVYDQAGSGGAGESAFNLRSAALTTMNGKAFRVRFLYEYVYPNSSFQNAADEYGWFIDAISFSGVSTLDTLASATVSGTSWSFTPEIGNYRISVIPVISGRDYPGSSQMLTVSEPLPSPPAPSYESWASALETTHGLAIGSLADPNGDPDKDGRPNLLEYAFGGSPVSASDPASRLPSAQATDTHFVLTYQVDASLSDLVIIPQACSTMGDWKVPGQSGAPLDFTDQIIATDGDLKTHEASIPLASAANCFLRIQVSRQ